MSTARFASPVLAALMSAFLVAPVQAQEASSIARPLVSASLPLTWPTRLQATLGHALLVPLPPGVMRVAVGDPQVADYQITAEGDLYLLGKTTGTTNLLLWMVDGQRRTALVEVQPDAQALSHLLERLFPQETDWQVLALPGGLVLRGSVADATVWAAMDAVARPFVARMAGSMRPQAGGASNAAPAAVAPSTPLAPTAAPASSPSAMPPGVMSAAAASSTLNTAAAAMLSAPPSPGAATVPPASLSPSTTPALVNLLVVRDPQQVVLEVKIAEVSKSLVERLGVRTVEAGQQMRWSLVSQFTGGAAEGTLGLILGAAGLSNMVLDAQKNDGLVKILAEPNIVALSGHEGRFLVGGRIFIPVTLPGANGGVATTLEERPYGVSLGFTPTVLAGSKVQLKVKAEVSEVAREPLRFSTGSSSAILPSITSRDVSTTVQMMGSQSLVIGGLLRSNRSQSMKAFPLLGELPIIGALFRSTDFNDDKTELVIVVTPRLLSTSGSTQAHTAASASPAAPALPSATPAAPAPVKP